MESMFCMLINMKVFCKLIVLFLMGLARHAQMVLVNLQYLCDILRKKPIMKLVLNCTDWFNTTLTIYYVSNVLPPLILFLSQYEAHTKYFLNFINCFWNNLFDSNYGRSMQVDLFFRVYQSDQKAK